MLEGLAQVREAAVIGLRDDDYGERVVAVVVLDVAADTVTEGDLISRCKEQLAGYKCP